MKIVSRRLILSALSGVLLSTLSTSCFGGVTPLAAQIIHDGPLTLVPPGVAYAVPAGAIAIQNGLLNGTQDMTIRSILIKLGKVWDAGRGSCNVMPPDGFISINLGPAAQNFPIGWKAYLLWNTVSWEGATPAFTPVCTQVSFKNGGDPAKTYSVSGLGPYYQLTACGSNNIGTCQNQTTVQTVNALN